MQASLVTVTVLLAWTCASFSLHTSESATPPSGTIPLHLLTLLPFPAPQGAVLSPSYDEGPDLLPAVELALSHVNRRRRLLDKYSLNIVAGDSGCEVTAEAHLSFVQNVIGNGRKAETRNIIGILGPVCSESSRDIATLVSRPSIALINLHRAGSLLLENKPEGPPYSFSMAVPALEVSKAATAFTQQVGWRRVAVLYEQNFYSEMFRQFAANAQKLDIEVAIAISNAEEILQSLRTIQDSNLRITLLFLRPELASQVLCLAESEAMASPNYQWVLMATSLEEIKEATSTRKTGECGTHPSVNNVLRDALLIQYRLRAVNIEETTDTGLSYNEFIDQYTESINRRNKSPNGSLYAPLTPSIYGGLLYDSVWAFALALNDSLATLQEKGLSLAQYTYGMPQVTQVISQRLLNLKFNGVSGRIHLSQDGYAMRPIEILQVADGGSSSRLVAEYSANNLSTISPQNMSIMVDSFPHIRPKSLLSVSMVFFSITFVHFILVVAVHIATCHFRNRPSVKATDNKLNHFIFAGGYLIFTAAILIILIKTIIFSDRVTGIICQALWPWLVSIGCTLTKGSIAIRTYIIYRIFIHSQHPGPFLSNRALIFALCVLLAIDVTIAIAWTAVDPLIVKISSIQQKTNNGQIFIYEKTSCESRSTPIFLIIIMVYKVLVHLSMFALSIITRKVKKKDYATLNIRIASYLLTLTMGLGFPLYFLLFFLDVEFHIDYSLLVIVFNLTIFINFVLVALPPVAPILNTMFCKHKPTNTHVHVMS